MNILSKARRRFFTALAGAALLPGLPAVTQAQFTYTTDDDNTITITGYTGSGGEVAIPATIDGLPVTGIGVSAFQDNHTLTRVTIPDSVTGIGGDAFGSGAFYHCTSLTNVTIGNGVTNIGGVAFDYCANLTSVIIGNRVASIGDFAFAGCYNLTSVYFKGNCPSAGGGIFNVTQFSYAPAVVLYLPGTTGWNSTFGGLPTALWQLPYPLILNNNPSFGVQSNQFGFTISWATNTTVVVETATNLFNPVWTPIATNILTGGTSYFSDPQWTNYPSRFYRLRSL